MHVSSNLYRFQTKWVFLFASVYEAHDEFNCDTN